MCYYALTLGTESRDGHESMVAVIDVSRLAVRVFEPDEEAKPISAHGGGNEHTPATFWSAKNVGAGKRVRALSFESRTRLQLRVVLIRDKQSQPARRMPGISARN
jgi:hypothetical protein